MTLWSMPHYYKNFYATKTRYDKHMWLHVCDDFVLCVQIWHVFTEKGLMRLEVIIMSTVTVVAIVTNML